MYLTRIAGIETRFQAADISARRMYLTRIAGIETVVNSTGTMGKSMYLTRIAGIETTPSRMLSRLLEDVSYPHSGN